MSANCPACQSNSEILFNKQGYDYYQCQTCKTVFIPGGLDQINYPVGGEHEEGRNEKENHLRMDRFVALVGKYAKILDWGAGHGLLVKDCKERGLDAVGYDKYNPDFDKLPDGKFHLISLVEVVEHLHSGFPEIETIYDKLVEGGIVYFETSFPDVAEQEGIPLNEFFYFSPQHGHCTVFSHAGLDIMMKAKGFSPLEHIDRNTRIYKKTGKMLTLITMTQGNPVALRRTIESMRGVINEVIIGDLCVYPEDRETILSYGQDTNIKMIQLPFNYIFKNGFANTLNLLSTYASNDWVVYMNVGEVVHQGKEKILSSISNQYNCYYLTHPTETHHWGRFYNRKELKWRGIIHEELFGDIRCCAEPIFMFDDTPKDQERTFYWEIMNDTKELVYFNLYVKLVDQPHLAEGTNSGWVDFSRDGFHSFIERMHQKGDMYEAMIRGDYELLMKAIEEKKKSFNV